ncbi:MAG: dihydrodipicolinate synthase family protein, partial [Mesorhizobium sp.]
RLAYAAAHVVANPFAMTDPWSRPAVDWDKTMAFRHHLWRLGFRIAEAMDTSQRGMGFDWASAKELIRRSIAEARTVKGADLASGAGTDHLTPAAARTLDDVI